MFHFSVKLAAKKSQTWTSLINSMMYCWTTLARHLKTIILPKKLGTERSKNLTVVYI